MLKFDCTFLCWIQSCPNGWYFVVLAISQNEIATFVCVADSPDDGFYDVAFSVINLIMLPINVRLKTNNDYKGRQSDIPLDNMVPEAPL